MGGVPRQSDRVSQTGSTAQEPVECEQAHERQGQQGVVSQSLLPAPRLHSSILSPSRHPLFARLKHWQFQIDAARDSTHRPPVQGTAGHRVDVQQAIGPSSITTRMRLAQAHRQARHNARQTYRCSVYLTLARAALRAVRLSPSDAFQAGIPYLSWIALAAA